MLQAHLPNMYNMFLNFISFVTETLIIYFINIVKVAARCHKRMFRLKRINNVHMYIKEYLFASCRIRYSDVLKDEIVEKLFLL